MDKRKRVREIKTTFTLFAVSPPGLEEVTAKELEALGLFPRPEKGGLTFQGGLEALYSANLHLRTASRILVKVAEFRALSFSELVSKTARYPWEIYLSGERALRIRVTCRGSRLYHSGAVAERILKGIAQRLSRPLVLTKEEEAPLVVVRLFRDQVLIRIDSSGRDLFKRGYKVAPGPAPLRENLAAALVYLSGWDEKAPFLDPFCGTGTIVIEAALIASRKAPGLGRRFAFEKWRNFCPELWENLKDKARKAERPPEAMLFASDISPAALAASVENAKAAGVLDWIRFQQADFKLLPPPATSGFLVTNPPFGARLRRPLSSLFGRTIQRKYSRWKITFIFPHRKPPLGLPVKILTSFDHGGRRVFVFKWSSGG